MKKILLSLLLSLFLITPVFADQAADNGKYRPLYRFLDETGDGTGNKDMTVNGSSTAVVFKFQPAAGETALVHRILIHMEDSGTFQASGYGSISASALTNGILLELRNTSDDSVVKDYLDGEPILSNANWSRMSFDLNYFDFGGGSTNKFITVRFSFIKSGQPVRISENRYLALIIQDDLTTMIDQTAEIQGYYN